MFPGTNHAVAEDVVDTGIGNCGNEDVDDEDVDSHFLVVGLNV